MNPQLELSYYVPHPSLSVLPPHAQQYSAGDDGIVMVTGVIVGRLALPTITPVTIPSMSVDEMRQLTNTLTHLVAALESPGLTPGILHQPSNSPTPRPVYHCNTRHTHPAPPHTAGIMRFGAKPHKCRQPCTFQGNAHASHYW